MARTAAAPPPPARQDAGLPLQRLCSAYREMVTILRTLYQRCRLVHADLSEYNILVHKVRPRLELASSGLAWSLPPLAPARHGVGPGLNGGRQLIGASLRHAHHERAAPFLEPKHGASSRGV
jgi:hypothetical protein